jgi:hypothetical protein
VADHCVDCDYAYVEGRAGEAADRCRDLARAIAGLVADGTDRPLRRPAPDVWSPLEYACHVRDVLLVQRERVLLALRVDDPSPEPMGRDERVDHDGYAAQHPPDVARQLVDAADLFANVVARLDDEAWGRGIVHGYPPPARRRTLRWVAVHTEHELLHHLGDIRRQLAAC